MEKRNPKDLYFLQKWLVGIEEKKYKANPTEANKNKLEAETKQLNKYKKLLGEQ